MELRCTTTQRSEATLLQRCSNGHVAPDWSSRWRWSPVTCSVKAQRLSSLGGT